MLSFLFKLIGYVGIGLLLTAVPEWQNNVLMNGEVSGWTGYLETLRVNSILLVFAYLSFRYLNSKYSPAKTLILQFTIWGLVGFSFEWFLIGNPPWSEALQYGMFVYWAVAFSTPALFLLESAREIRLKVASFFIATAFLMVVVSLALFNLSSSKVFLLLFTLVSWVLVYSYGINFFFQGVGYKPKTKILLSLAILTSFMEIILPFPFSFLVFLIIILGSYWYVMKNLVR